MRIPFLFIFGSNANDKTIAGSVRHHCLLSHCRREKMARVCDGIAFSGWKKKNWNQNVLRDISFMLTKRLHLHRMATRVPLIETYKFGEKENLLFIYYRSQVYVSMYAIKMFTNQNRSSQSIQIKKPKDGWLRLVRSADSQKPNYRKQVNATRTSVQSNRCPPQMTINNGQKDKRLNLTFIQSNQSTTNEKRQSAHSMHQSTVENSKNRNRAEKTRTRWTELVLVIHSIPIHLKLHRSCYSDLLTETFHSASPSSIHPSICSFFLFRHRRLRCFRLGRLSLCYCVYTTFWFWKKRVRNKTKIHVFVIWEETFIQFQWTQAPQFIPWIFRKAESSSRPVPAVRRWVSRYCVAVAKRIV